MLSPTINTCLQKISLLIRKPKHGVFLLKYKGLRCSYENIDCSELLGLTQALVRSKIDLRIGESVSVPTVQSLVQISMILNCLL